MHDLVNVTPIYVGLDIETTGLNPQEHQVLELAAVAWCNEGTINDQPCFTRIIDPGTIKGSKYALELNAELICLIKQGKGKPLGFILTQFYRWLQSLGVSEDNKVHLVGANVGSFDLQFLKRHPMWPSHAIHHRCLEVGSMYATPFGIHSLGSLPYLDIPGKPHEALYDAKVALHHAIIKLKENNVTT